MYLCRAPIDNSAFCALKGLPCLNKSLSIYLPPVIYDHVCVTKGGHKSQHKTRSTHNTRILA